MNVAYICFRLFPALFLLVICLPLNAANIWQINRSIPSIELQQNPQLLSVFIYEQEEVEQPLLTQYFDTTEWYVKEGQHTLIKVKLKQMDQFDADAPLWAELEIDGKRQGGRFELRVVAANISVEGYVESRTGGFKFPDGSTQITAMDVACDVGEYLRVDGSGNVLCETDMDSNSGGTVTSVTAGTGLTGGEITGIGTIDVATGGISESLLADGAVTATKINTSQVQQRVTGGCPAEQFITSVNQDGSVVCSSTPDVNLDSISGGAISNSFNAMVCGGSNLVVPDGLLAGLQDTISIPDLGLSTTFSVAVDTSNTGGLNNTRISLVSPTSSEYVLWCGKNVVLWENCIGDTVATTINTSYPDVTPVHFGDLGTWIGANPVGDWKLKIIDQAADGVDGELGSWCINFDYNASAAVATSGDLQVQGELSLGIGRIIRQINVQVDTTTRFFTPTWELGSTFSTIPGFKAGSLVRLSYHVPTRNDDTGWGGGYIEPQISFDAGSNWNSLGSSGYDAGVMSNGSSVIGSYNNTLLIDPAQSADFDVRVRFYHKAYIGTLTINGSNGINSRSNTAPLMSGVNGTQHYTRVIVEELH